MLRSRVKTGMEIMLERMPEPMLGLTDVLFSALKKFLASVYRVTGTGRLPLRICDFILVRCHGNRFTEFELSNICNARCIFCPYPDMLKSGKKFMHMQEDVLKTCMSRFGQLKSGLISITPTTGDTLLHPEWNRFIGEILGQGRIRRATLFTNAIELEEENRAKMLALLQGRNGDKLSEVFFSVGGPDAESYRELYQVDRFEKVRENISSFLKLLKENRMSTGIHIHIKLPKGKEMDDVLAEDIFNRAAYTFVYFSRSSLYYANSAYKRNALLGYREGKTAMEKKACAYLYKTRFAADGSIWADGCVISELPGDSSLRLGGEQDTWEQVEKNRKALVNAWEKEGNLPLPCRGCTMYRPS